MKIFFNKLSISYKFIKNVFVELLFDLYFYYTSSYPLLLIIGAYKRIKKRIKYLWYPKGPGRPPVPENIIDLILDMKRSNWPWGALRISQELMLMGIAAGNETWAMDFCNIIDLKLFQIYILGIININTREIIWQAITIHPNRE